eukprot:TCONS_00020680-protein
MQLPEDDEDNEEQALWIKHSQGQYDDASNGASIDAGNENKRTQPWFLLPASVTVAALGGVLFGYDVGIISGAILLLREEFNLTCIQQELVVTVLLIGGLISSFVGGFFLDQFGRKTTIILNAFLFLIGALVLSFANGFGIFIIGRLILGFAVALSAVGDCVYISEIAPPKKRGLLVSLNELGITLGLLLAYFVNYILIDSKNGWRYMFGISAIPALGQAIGMAFLPKSPRWLLLKGQEEKAMQIAATLWPNLNVRLEIDRMKTSLSREQSYSFLDLFSSKDNMRMRMMIGCSVILFQQLTGQPTVLYYAPVLFKRLGFNMNTSATLATIGLGIVKVVFTMGTLLSVDKLGRRKFLLVGATIMTISLITLSAVTEPFQNGNEQPACHDYIGTQKVHSHLLNVDNNNNRNCTIEHFNNTIIDGIKNKTLTHKKLGNSSSIIKKTLCRNSTKNKTNLRTDHDNDDNDAMGSIPGSVKYTCLFALMLFVIGYAVGYGPMSWLILTEIFPTAIKGRAASVATSVNWGTNIVISLTFLDVLGSLGPFLTFLCYSVIGVVSIIFLYHIVPETKGKSLEEISEHLNERRVKCSTVRCCAEGQMIYVQDDEGDILLNDNEAEDIM